MVSFSRLPSAEPEATMALSMSPVARWQTQYSSASRGACGGDGGGHFIIKRALIIATTRDGQKKWFWR